MVWWLCVCKCVFTGVRIRVCRNMWRPDVCVGCLSAALHPIFWDQVSDWTWNAPVWLDWTVNGLRWATCLRHHGTGATVQIHTVPLNFACSLVYQVLVLLGHLFFLCSCSHLLYCLKDVNHPFEFQNSALILKGQLSILFPRRAPFIWTF